MDQRTQENLDTAVPFLIVNRDDPWLAQKLLLWFACPDRSHLQRIILVAFNTWYDNMENRMKAKTKKNTHNRAYSIQHSHLAEMNSLSFSSRVILLVLVSRRRPSLMPAVRSLLAGGDSCCCHCFRVPRKVCLNEVAPPQSVLFAVVP